MSDKPTLGDIITRIYEPAIREQAKSLYTGALMRFTMGVTDEQGEAWERFCDEAPIEDLLNALDPVGMHDISRGPSPVAPTTKVVDVEAIRLIVRQALDAPGWQPAAYRRALERIGEIVG